MAGLSADAFSKMASALMGKSEGGVDITKNRAQLMAFAEALVAGDSDQSDMEESPTAVRPKTRGRPRKGVKPESPVPSSDESEVEQVPNPEDSNSEDEEAALEKILMRAQESVTSITNPEPAE